MARLYWSLRPLILPVKVSGGAYSGVTPPRMPEALARSRCLTRPKSATLTRSPDQEQVARLDVEVLQVVLLVHVVERLGGVAHVAQQVVAGDADQPGRLALDVKIVQALVGQLHDDDQLALDHLDALQRQDEGMADFLDAVEGLAFLLGATPSTSRELRLP